MEHICFFSAARSLLAGLLIPGESAASLLSLALLPPQRVWHGICTSHRVGSKEKRNGSQASRKRHIGGWPKVFAFHFLSRCASDTKEIL
jgi:hypothetical protein